MSVLLFELHELLEHIFPVGPQRIPVEAELQQPFNAFCVYSSLPLRCALDVHPHGQVMKLTRFAGYAAMSMCLLEMLELDKHFFPCQCKRIPNEADSVQPLKASFVQAVTPASLG